MQSEDFSCNIGHDVGFDGPPSKDNDDKINDLQEAGDSESNLVLRTPLEATPPRFPVTSESADTSIHNSTWEDVAIFPLSLEPFYSIPSALVSTKPDVTAWYLL